MYKLTVLLRTCDRINAFSGYKPRDFGSKKDVINKCCLSIKKSIDYFISQGGECDFIIIDDHSSNETVKFLISLEPNKFISITNSGNGESFGKCLEIAKNCSGLVFMIEDDYLLKRECIQSMVFSYHKIKSAVGKEICIHPTDYPDRYEKLYPSYIILGSDRHYRTIMHTTCTFMYDSLIFKEFEKELNNFCNYGKVAGVSEDNSINLVYNKYMCFSPIPSLAEHYQYYETLSPFFKENIQ